MISAGSLRAGCLALLVCLSASCANTPGAHDRSGFLDAAQAVPGLRRIADVVHAAGARISAQIGHAGPVAAATGRRGLAPSRTFSPMAFRFTRPIDEAGIARVVGDFASAARLLADAGFDWVLLDTEHSPDHVPVGTTVDPAMDVTMEWPSPRVDAEARRPQRRRGRRGGRRNRPGGANGTRGPRDGGDAPKGDQ